MKKMMIALLCFAFMLAFIGCNSAKLTDNNNDFPLGTVTEPQPEAQSGVYIPKIELPEAKSGVEIDMLGTVVDKNGRIFLCYNYGEPFSLAYEASAEQVLGEYVGTGDGSIGEWGWEADPENQNPLQSSIIEDFYTVKGYDSDFRLAGVASFDNGERTIFFYDSLNDITLTTGADLFETRLHLKDNFTSVTYQLHDDWDYGKQNFQTLSVDNETMLIFLDTLYASEFVDLYDTPLQSEIYNQKQAHLYFTLQDGSTVGLQLFEDGYIGYAGYSGAYVYMPGEIFDTVFEAAAQTDGIYIPAIEPPTPDPMGIVEMLGMVVDNEGRVFVDAQPGAPHSLDYETHKSLLGEYVGTGDYSLDAHAENIASDNPLTSNTPFRFYTVNGYSPDFLLAAVLEYDDETPSVIRFYHHLNDITLQTGADLYEERLHLKDNIAAVEYQTDADWNRESNEYQSLSDIVSDTDWQNFLQTLYDSEFVAPELTDSEALHDFYDKKQAHIYCKMNDGTTVELRLFDGGYVDFAGTLAEFHVYVYMPGEIFDTVFEAATK